VNCRREIIRNNAGCPCSSASRQPWCLPAPWSDQTAGLLTLRESGPFGLYGSPTRGSWNCDAMSNNGHADTRALHNPLGLLAELTHRCPLGCPYCSNPLAMDGRDDELDATTWARVFREAAGLGVLQVHLSGGEPASRRDLADIMAAARNAGLYTNLITSGVGVTDKRLCVRDSRADHRSPDAVGHLIPDSAAAAATISSGEQPMNFGLCESPYRCPAE
jgi:hypothetical protein